MLIQEMSRQDCLKALARTRLFRLACAKDNQPYVVPVYFTFQQADSGEAYLYGFTTLGQKTEWMRVNGRVCAEMDNVLSHDHWVSVVVFGTYQELPDTVEHAQDRQRAIELLQEHAMWWEPGATARAASVHRDPSKPFTPIFYRIQIHRVTGHRCGPIPVRERAI